MAGPSIGTWVKVRNKSGRMTAKVIAKTWGATPEKGSVITQSQYLEAKAKGEEVKRVSKNIEEKLESRYREIDEQMNRQLSAIPERFTRKRQKTRDKFDREKATLDSVRKAAMEGLRLKRNSVKEALGVPREQLESYKG